MSRQLKHHHNINHLYEKCYDLLSCSLEKLLVQDALIELKKLVRSSSIDRL